MDFQLPGMDFQLCVLTHALLHCSFYREWVRRVLGCDQDHAEVEEMKTLSEEVTSSRRDVNFKMKTPFS